MKKKTHVLCDFGFDLGLSLRRSGFPSKERLSFFFVVKSICVLRIWGWAGGKRQVVGVGV